MQTEVPKTEKPPAVSPGVNVKENKVIESPDGKIDPIALESLEAKVALTEEEIKALPLSVGIRGQIKKILRPWVDDQRASHRYMNTLKEDLVERLNNALNKMDKEYKGLYAGMMRQVLGPVDQKLANLDLYVSGMIETIACQFYLVYKTIDQEGDSSKKTLEKYMEEFKEMVLVRAKKIHEDTEKRHKEELEKKRKQAKESQAKLAQNKKESQKENKSNDTQDEGSKGEAKEGDQKSSEDSSKDSK